MFTPEEAKNLLVLLNRVNVTGQEATTVALLMQKLQTIAEVVIEETRAAKTKKN